MIPVLILGESGCGKTFSLKNLDPLTTLQIQCTPKRLPFRSADWKKANRATPAGSIIETDSYAQMHKIFSGAPNQGKDKIIVDDYNYALLNEEMRRSDVKNFDKYTEMAKNFWELISHAQQQDGDERVYFMMHTETTKEGLIIPKTSGKFLAEKLIVAGMFTIVLRCDSVDGRHYFHTKTNGYCPTKTPEDMFQNSEIPNDLALVDEAITSYYGITG